MKLDHLKNFKSYLECVMQKVTGRNTSPVLSVQKGAGGSLTGFGPDMPSVQRMALVCVNLLVLEIVHCSTVETQFG